MVAKTLSVRILNVMKMTNGTLKARRLGINTRRVRHKDFSLVINAINRHLVEINIKVIAVLTVLKSSIIDATLQ